MTILVLVGLPIMYLVLAIYLMNLLLTKTEGLKFMPRSIWRSISFGVLFAPGFIGGQGFAWPAPASVAAIVMIRSPEIVKIFLASISILSILAFIILLIINLISTKLK